MHTGQSQSSRTDDSIETAGTPMAESCHKFIRLERSRVRTGRRLLFSLLWDRSTSKLKSTSQEVISHLKAIFARHGIPETVISGNGPQYSSTEFSKFPQEWGFSLVTSSPKYPQSNGNAERTVQTMKNLLTKAEDSHEALLTYRATPPENGFSLAQLWMGRKLRTTLPTIPSKLIPQWPELSKLRETARKIKGKQAVQ